MADGNIRLGELKNFKVTTFIYDDGTMDARAYIEGDEKKKYSDCDIRVDVFKTCDDACRYVRQIRQISKGDDL